VASTTKGQDGADLAALKGLTIPVHLTGPFEAMDWRIQWSAIAAQAIKTEVGAQVKDRLKEKLGLPGAASGASGTSDSAAMKDAAKEKLKGLFK
jgi:AsmA protein